MAYFVQVEGRAAPLDMAGIARERRKLGARAFVAPRAASHGVPAPDYRFSGFRELAS